MSGDGDTLYELTTGEYKESVSKDSFAYETNVDLKGFSIEKIEIANEGTKALVSVKITVERKGFDFNFPINEEWLYEKGVWCLPFSRSARVHFNRKRTDWACISKNPA